MATTQKDIINDLNHLISLNVDAIKGYGDAGNESDSGRLRVWMFNVAKEREHFKADLQSIVRAMGSEPENDGSFLGSLHRAWISIKGDATDETNEEMLEECIRGEEKAVEDYEKVLRHNLTPNARTVVQGQLDQIRNDLQKLRAMEELVDQD